MLFAYATVMVYQEELRKEVPHLIESLTGIHTPHEYETVVTVVVMLIAIYGIGKAYDSLFPGRDKKHISDTQERLVCEALEEPLPPAPLPANAAQRRRPNRDVSTTTDSDPQ